MYGYLGSMRTRPGTRDDVVEVLTGDGLMAAGERRCCPAVRA